MASVPRRLRVLCLHGKTQSAAYFRERTGSLRRACKGIADFVFVSGPYAVEPPARSVDEGDCERITSESGSPVEERSATSASREWCAWWPSPAEADIVSGARASLALLADTARADGPFDGVLAFSQGASLCSLLCAALEEGDDAVAPLRSIRFVVLCAGFRTRAAAHASRYVPRGFNMPSLHFYGAADQLVPPAESEALAACFATAELRQHEGGHLVPFRSEDKKAVAAFMRRFAAS